MKFIILFVVAFLPFSFCISQNLVPNGDFELYTELPQTPGDWHLCNDWSNVNGQVSSGTTPFGSPDYLHLNGTWFGSLPNSSFGYVFPQSGDALMHFITYYEGDGIQQFSNFREYISIELSEPLVIGSTYNLSIWLTVGEASSSSLNYSSNHIGFLFSTSMPYQEDIEPINEVPQFEITENFWNEEWQNFNFEFIANQAHTNLTIGNFFDDANTNIVLEYPTNNGSVGAHCFIDNIELIKNEDPPIIIGDEIICQGDSAALEIINAADFYWANSSDPDQIISTEPLISVTPEETTTYIAQGLGFSVTHTVTVENNPIIDLGGDVNPCEGEVFTLSNPIPGASYLWSDGSEDDVLQVINDGAYSLEVTTENGCWGEDMVLVNFSPIPTIDLGADFDLCNGDSTELSVDFPNAYFQWNDGSDGNTLVVNTPGIYTVTALLENCSYSTSVFVDVYNCAGYMIPSEELFPPVVYIPNAFTPNEDGFNDSWKISTQHVSEFDLTIYDRYGQSIFSSKDSSIGWVGNVNGGEYYTQNEIYTYRLVYSGYTSEKKEITGHISIIR